MATLDCPRKPGRPKDPDLEARRKDEILAAAATVFAQSGFAETDVQDIAERAGASKGTVYRYFPTKEELFLAAVDRGLQDLCRTCDAALAEESLAPLERVVHGVTAYLQFFHERPEMAELFIQERAAFRDRHQPLYFATTPDQEEREQRDTRFVKAMIDAGLFRNVDPKQVLDVFGDLLFGTIISNHLAGRRVSPDVQARAILDVMFHGLLSESGKSQFAMQKPVRKAKIAKLSSFALMLGLAMVGAAGCQPKDSTEATKAAPAIPVAVQPVAVRSIARTVSVVGTLNGWEEVLIAPKTDGRIFRVRADIGDRVVPGQRLLELDETDYRLAVNEAKRAMDAELARLGLKELPTGALDVEVVPGVRVAAVAVDDVARRLKVKQELRQKNAASEDEVETLKTDLQTAQARKNQAVTEAETAYAAAKLRKAQLDMAEQRLRDCMVEAPIPEGYGAWAAVVGPGFVPVRYVVAARMASEGEMIRSNPVTNTFKLILDFSLKLRVQVPEQYVASVRVGLPVDIRVDAFPDRPFTGRVARVNPTIDPQNRTFGVEVEVPNAAGTLKAGGFAKATIRIGQESARTVPTDAIVSFAGVTKVFLFDGDHAKAVEVKTGTRDKDWVEIIGPIPDGSKVIVSGLSLVVDGSAVRIRE